MARPTCPQCGSDNTWAHYEHQVSSVGPGVSKAHVWEREAEILPDGRPISVPCPGCTDGIQYPPLYFYCQACNHIWSPNSGIG